MENFADRFLKIVSRVLLGFCMLIIVLYVVQLIWSTYQLLAVRFEYTGFSYTPGAGKTVAVLFFNILLMIGILHTIRVFSHGQVTKVRVILIVCLIAAGQKILAIGENPVDPLAEISLGALVISLALGYYLMSRHAKDTAGKNKKEHHHLS